MLEHSENTGWISQVKLINAFKTRFRSLDFTHGLGMATNFEAGKKIFFLKFLRAGNSKVDKVIIAMRELTIKRGKLAENEQLPVYYI